jgi:hypothetical protein
MDDHVNDGSRRIDAAEANRMAQEFDNEALGINAPVHEIPTRNRGETDPVEATPAIMEEAAGDSAGGQRIFPPNLDGATTIGGDPETRAALRQEESG